MRKRKIERGKRRQEEWIKRNIVKMKKTKEREREKKKQQPQNTIRKKELN